MSVGQGMDNYKGGDSINNLFTDNFNRANAGNFGANWLEYEDPTVDPSYGHPPQFFNIANNVAILYSAAGDSTPGDYTFQAQIGIDIPLLSTAIGDQHSEIQLGTLNNQAISPEPTLLVRANGTAFNNFTGYVAWLAQEGSSTPGTQYYISYVDTSTNTFTTLGHVTLAGATAGDIFRLEAVDGIFA